MTSPTGSAHEHSARGCTKISRTQRTGCILRNHIDTGNAKRRKLIATEEPCRTLDVEDNRMATGARGVNADSLYIAQRAEDVGFEQVRMAGRRDGR